MLNNKLKHTHHTIQMLEQQYIDDLDLFNDDRSFYYMKRILELEEFEKQIMILFLEYGSYRMVSDETTYSHVTITKKIKEIKEKICAK